MNVNTSGPNNQEKVSNRNRSLYIATVSDSSSMMRLVFLVVVCAICVSASSGDELRPEVEQQQSGSFCQGCRSIVSFMSRFNSSTRRDENKELLGKFCETYHPVGPCPVFVEGFFTILDRISTVEMCDDIGACSTNYLPSKANSPSAKNAHRVVCDACTDIVKEVQVTLEDPRVIDDIRHKVDAFFKYLTVITANSQSRDAPESYIDQALDFIKKREPKDLCRSLRLCTAESSPAVVSVNSKLSTKENQLEKTQANFNGIIETSNLVGGKQLKSVDKFGENVKKLSSNCSVCEKLVRDVFKLFNSPCPEWFPKVYCMLLGQCLYQRKTPRTKSLAHSLRRPTSISTNKPIIMDDGMVSMLDPTIRDSSMECAECKIFFKQLQKNIRQPSRQVKIKNWVLQNLCANLPDKNLTESCTKYVDQESAVFFKTIIASLDPQKNCVMLGICKAHLRSDQMLQQFVSNHGFDPSSLSVKQTSTAVDKPLCNQCTQIVTKIRNYSLSHTIERDISVLKDKVCITIQSDKLRDKCVSIIQTYGQKIIDAISNMDNPHQLCQKMSLCSASH